jgi:hypothetical protein
MAYLYHPLPNDPFDRTRHQVGFQLEGVFKFGNDRVRFIGDIDLTTPAGNGHLVKE